MFPPEIEMPMDVTMPLYLSKQDFVFTAASTVPRSVRSSCLRFQQQNCVNKTQPEDGAKKGKRVTFADHKGLSLTQVKIFSRFTDPIEIPVNIQETLSSKLRPSSPEEDKLVLDFAQPSSDYLRFRQNLEQNLVSLERCVLEDQAFAGTVKVKNVSFEKSVTLRVTFDSWRSHADVGCDYVEDAFPAAFPAAYGDTFSFRVSLPARMRQAEFAVRYRVSGSEFWDSNRGRNYRIVRSGVRENRRLPDPFGPVHLDRYGGPTCSLGLDPDWPGYAGYENVGPYY